MSTDTTPTVKYFDLAREAYRSGNRGWLECSSDHAEYCLGVLPPIYGPAGSHAFAVSEPICGSRSGDVFHWIRRKGEAIQCRDASKAEIISEFAACAPAQCNDPDAEVNQCSADDMRRFGFDDDDTTPLA